MDAYLLSLIIFAPLVGAVVGFVLLPRRGSQGLHKGSAMLFSIIPLVASALLLGVFHQGGWRDGAGVAFNVLTPWFNVGGEGGLTVYYALYVDGLSLPLVVLTALITPLCIYYSDIEDRAREYYAFFLLLEVGMLGTFLAADFFLFYVFWELSLLPMYFIIGIWGGANREYAAIKFFIYTLIGSVAMLLALIWIYLIVPQKTLLFVDYSNLTGAGAPASLLGQTSAAIEAGPKYFQTLGILAWWGIFLAFAIKVPTWPFHTWLPDAHTEAPTAGSVILAGVLLKMGGYGILRILLPLLPDQSYQMRYVLLVMAVIGVVYGAFVAMAQADLKKLIAYSSVNHMGYVMMGVAAGAAVLYRGVPDAQMDAARTAMSGAIYQMIAHGLLTSGLFFLVGILYDRTHTRALTDFGGLGKNLQEYAGYFRLFVFGSLGLPGLAGFVAEFLVFMGTFQADPAGAAVPWFRIGAVVAGLGIIITAAFLLWTIQRVLLGPLNPRWAKLPDVLGRERAPLLVLGALALLFGILPHLLLQTMGNYLDRVPQFIAGLSALR